MTAGLPRKAEGHEISA